jgi:hypothetical protein
MEKENTAVDVNVIVCILPSASNCSEIWNANSLVGVRIKAK